MSSILNSILAGDLQVQKCPRDHPVKGDSILKDFNTGFGENNDLHYEHPCIKPILKTPLYRENCLSEFETEEEKAAVRHSLGLYNKEDIVAMSLLTAEDSTPSKSELDEAPIKQLRKGDKFFAPITTINAIYDLDGKALGEKLTEIKSLISKQDKKIQEITQVSDKNSIHSLGDVQVFLGGFKKEDTLYDTIEDIKQDMLRFEYTGSI